MTNLILGLLIALLIPWISTTLLILALAGPSRESGRPLIALGFGFFVSLALTSWGVRGLGLLSPDLDGASALHIGFLAIALLSLLAMRRRSAAVPLSRGGHTDARPALTLPSWIRVTLFLLLALHLGYSLLEIITQPVFPWDGWTLWVFRAKAWFLSNELVPILNFNQWFWQDASPSYTTTALLYPWMVSIIALWAALGMGQWHEALVNVPTLLAALAVGLGLIGLLRGLEITGALLWIAAYLLFSTPLFSVHMSLGGYADIWMCGFSGLGMAAVLSGLTSGHKRNIFLGLGMLLLGLGVKAEGIIWLAIALATLAVIKLPLRFWLLFFIFMAVGFGVAIWSGVTTVEVPGLGLLGWSDGALVLPIKGLVYLQKTDVWSAYGRNALMLGSWNLLWPILTAVLLLLAAHRRSQPVTRVAWSFAVIFVGFQVLIFGFTAEGAWARDFTAINRVPLQLLPAFIFLITLGIQSLLAERPLPTVAELRQPLLYGAVIAGGFTLFAVIVLLRGTGDSTPAPPMEITDSPLSYLLGSGTVTDGAVAPKYFANGLAVVSSGAVAIETKDYSLLDVKTSYQAADRSLDQAPAFFWRRQGQAFEVNRVTLTHSGPIDLSQRRDWSGQIVEYGFFFTDADPSVEITDARLLDPGPADLLRLIARQWLTFDGWTQRSANWIGGGNPEALIPLTPLVALLVLGIAFVSWMLLGRQFGTPVLIMCLLSGWLIVDVRWLLERSHQAQGSWHSIRNETLDQRMVKGDLGKNQGWLQALLTEHLAIEPQRLLVVPDPKEHEYFALRAKYQLLPHSSAVVRWRISKKRLAQVDYVLFLGDFNRSTGTFQQGVDGDAPPSLAQQLKISRSARKNLDLVTIAPEGVLFRVKRP